MAITDPIRDYIVNEVSDRVPANELHDDYPLLDKGVVDSVGLFRLVAFLEEEFAVRIEDRELSPDNFGSLGSIARLVESKRSG